MKTLFSVTALALNLNALAAEPTVICSLNWVLKDAKGITLKYVPSQNVTVTVNKPIQIENNGFTLKASLRQICATDGGPCFDSYDLDTTIENGENFAATSSQVKASDRSRQYLNTGNLKQNAFSLCDVE